MLPFDDPAQLDLFIEIISIATSYNLLSALYNIFGQIDKFISEWKLTNKNKRRLYAAIIDSFSTSDVGTKEKFDFIVKYIKSF